MESLKLYLFGVPRFEYAGTSITLPRRKSIALVAYLALNLQPRSRESLAALLWPSLDEQRAHTALRSTLYSLRAALPGIDLVPNHRSLSLDSERIWIDVHAFRSALVESRSHAHSLDSTCERCAGLLAQAVDIPQGDFLAGFSLDDSTEFDHWQLFQRDMLQHELGSMLRRLAEYYGSEICRAYDTAIAYAQRWLALDPLNEPAHRLLMRLYGASGQPKESLRQYQKCAALLREELLTEPEEETTILYEAVQRSYTATTVVSSSGGEVMGALPPLPSLLIGREKALTDLRSRLGVFQAAQSQVNIVIQGWPGVGKSTLAAALAHDTVIHQIYPDGVLWTSLGESPNLAAKALMWAKALRIVDNRVSYEIGELTALLTAALREKRMLLLVDDVWSIEHAAPFRVGGRHCAQVFTSRLNDVAEALTPMSTDIYRLAVLTQASGLQLLSMLAPDAVAQYPEESYELIQTLEGLPLAIQVAGKLLYNEMKFGWGLRELLQELQEGARLLKAQLPSDMLASRHEASPTVAALLQRSTDVLDTVTQQRFADLGLFSPKPATFDLQAMTVLWQMSDARPTARILVNRGLLEPVSGGRFQMHALLVLHARSLSMA